MPAERRLGFIAILASAAGYAFLPVFTRLIYRLSDLQPTDIALWRFIFATPTIWLVILLRERWQPHKRPPASIPVLRLLPLGFLYAVATVITFVGLHYIAASLFIVLFYTYPAMVALIALVMGQRLPLIGWIALVLTLIGVILTVPDFSGLEQNSIIGIVIAFGDAFVIAVYFLVAGRVMEGIASMGRGTAWVITGTFLMLLFIIPIYGLSLPANLQIWLMLLALAVFSTAMPILLINVGIQLIGAPQASIISSAEPLMTMLLAMLLLGEILLPVQWLGGILIVAGVILLEIRPTRKAAIPNMSGVEMNQL